MHFTDPKAQAEFDARTATVGVLIEDKKSRLLYLIREGLRDKKILLLRKKQKFVLKI